MFYANIPEPEARENTEATLWNFLIKEMKISSENMKKIGFDWVHRTGQKVNGKPRLIIAKFNPSLGKELVLKHGKNLDKRKNFGVNVQLPRELEERRKQLLPKFRETRNNQKPAKWSLDKLIIDNKVEKIERDTMRDINTITTEVAKDMKIKRAPPMTHNKSSFQGHATVISSQDDIIPALHAIYQIQELPEHLTMYMLIGLRLGTPLLSTTMMMGNMELAANY